MARQFLFHVDFGFSFSVVLYFYHQLLLFMTIFVLQVVGRISGNNSIDVTTLLTLKLEFIRIVCSHEHYATLNLPFNLPVTPSGPPSPSSIASSTSQTSFTSTGTLIDRGLFTELSYDFRHQHFLTGLVLSDLVTALETQ